MWRKYNSGYGWALAAGTALLGGCLIGCAAQGPGGREAEMDAVVTQNPKQDEAGSVSASSEAYAPEDTISEETVVEEPVSGTDIDLYGCSPVTEELSDIPAMENKLYAAWDGKIYYRQYSDEDMEDGGLWADFEPIAGTEKELMCMESDGSVSQVGVDYGCEEMFIACGRIYSQKYTEPQENSGSRIRSSVVYSCSLDGSDVREYDSARVLAAKGDRIICQTVNEGLSFIDTQTGQEYVLMEQYAVYLEADEEELFCFYYPKDAGEDAYDVTLCSLDYTGNVHELKTITREEYAECMGENYLDMLMFEKPIDIPCFKTIGDDLYFSAGSYNGNGSMYTGGPIYSMKRDGSGCRIEAVSYERNFYLYDDGINRSMYCTLIDESTSRGLEGIRQISLCGEEQDIVLRMPYRPYEEPYVHIVYDSENDPVGDFVMIYPDTSGVCYVLLTGQETEELGIRTHVDGHVVQQLNGIEYLDGKLFFTVTDLIYSTEYSIGWRDGYERGRSACYCKDIDSGRISLLYEY